MKDRRDCFQPVDGFSLLKKLSFSGVKGRIQPNVDMGRMTWFRTSALAELLYQPVDEKDLRIFLRQLPKEIPLLVIGVGSNLLVRDGGVKGVVVRLSSRGFGAIYILENERILCGAAVSGKRLAASACEAGIADFHFYHGIPGGVGGALRMNAGANGIETANRVLQIRALDRKGEQRILHCQDMLYSYRQSKGSEEMILVSATFQGCKGEQKEILKKMQKVEEHREKVQPVYEKTGGSTFRNPQEITAWRIIDKVGCRGMKVGGAQISVMHSNFMINAGNATGYDLELLGEIVRKKVFEQSGIRLCWEIQRVGQFSPGKDIKKIDF